MRRHSARSEMPSQIAGANSSCEESSVTFRGFERVDNKPVAEGSNLLAVRPVTAAGRSELYLDASPYWDGVCSDRRSVANDRSIGAAIFYGGRRPTWPDLCMYCTKPRGV